MDEAEVLKRVRPDEFVSSLLDHGVRTDGREKLETRPLRITAGVISSALGSARVSVGGTVAVCAVKGEIGVPHVDAPTQGAIETSIHFPPLCAPRFTPGKPPELALVTGDFVASVIDAAGAVDLSRLSIAPGVAAWQLHVDVVFSSFDGSAADVAVLAALAALRSTLLPAVVEGEGAGDVLRVDPRTVTRLVSRPLPVAALTCAVCGAARAMLADPVALEEDHARAAITVACGAGGAIIAVSKFGGEPMPFADVLQAGSMCAQRVAEAERLTEEAVEAEWTRVRESGKEVRVVEG